MKRWFLLLALSACATPMAQLKLELGIRSSDALACPEQELEYEAVENLFSTTRARVTGCGKAVTWKLVESRWTREREP